MRAVLILLYVAAALGVLAFLVWYEVGKVPKVQRARLRATALRQARRMEKTKRRLALLPPVEPEVPNKPPPKGRRY